MINVHVIPILEDNYCFLVENTADQSAVIIDPGESAGVIAALEQRQLKPVAIWNTHHHSDHVDGNAGILERYGPLLVVGSDGDRGRIAQLNHFVHPGDTLEFGGETVKVLGVPGHTISHIAFYFPSGHLFSGDLLFGYSCGAVFEGTMEQMYHSVSQLLEMPDSTQVYCGHEYTLNNRKWAQYVDPDNVDVQQRIGLETDPPTVPLQLGVEKRTNHFLRCTDPKIQAFTGKTDPAEVFAALRIQKNNFK
ncbi:hydroxyacylglutathione hydrolase [bacterium]|nr:hydroxyacylglutathione hydrolase [bacterium]